MFIYITQISCQKYKVLNMCCFLFFPCKITVRFRTPSVRFRTLDK